jgi:5-methylcytosine-specific restriction protein A
VTSGWEGSDRRETLPPNWAGLVKAVWIRDKGQCRWRLTSGARCPRGGRDVDHIGDREDHGLKNLRLLCGHHHEAHTARQAREAKAKKKGLRRRPPEEHPGRLR